MHPVARLLVARSPHENRHAEHILGLVHLNGFVYFLWTNILAEVAAMWSRW